MSSLCRQLLSRNCKGFKEKAITFQSFSRCIKFSVMPCFERTFLFVLRDIIIYLGKIDLQILCTKLWEGFNVKISFATLFQESVIQLGEVGEDMDGVELMQKQYDEFKKV